MGSRQRTFSLVPASLAKPSGQKPPMTSKAAKKAYQLANQGPKISRAERRRLDREELEQQKKEYERERASIKAKAAREKKAAKANSEKDARKKMGLPEPSRFVRASQPTISHFVKANGKRKWEEMDSLVEDSGAIVCDMDTKKKDEAQAPADRITLDEESGDEFGDFPSLSQADLLEKLDSSAVSTMGGDSGPVPGALMVDQPLKLLEDEESQERKRRKPSDDRYPMSDSQFLANANTQLLLEAAEISPKSDSAEPTITCPLQTKVLRSVYETRLRDTIGAHEERIEQKPSSLPRPVLRERSVNMPPPTVIFKEGIPRLVETTPQRSRFPLQNTARANLRPLPNIPPSSTQAFLEEHLVDFLPSPSQEIRELLEDFDDFPTNTQVAKELSQPKLNDIKLSCEKDLSGDLICTQDFVLSPQDWQEIDTPSRAPPAPRAKRRFFEEKEDDLFVAAIYESKVWAAQEVQKVPLKSKRVLHRVQSTGTDYGDVLSEDELLAICQ